MLLFWTVWMLLVMVAALMGGYAAAGAGFGAGLALGCLTVFPLAFVAMLLAFWSWFAQAEIVARDCGVWVGLLGGLRLVTRCLGTVIGLSVVLVIVVVGSATVFMLLTLTLNSASASFGGVRMVLTWLVQAVQWLVGAIIHLSFVAAIVGLARGEHADLDRREVTP